MIERALAGHNQGGRGDTRTVGGRVDRRNHPRAIGHPRKRQRSAQQRPELQTGEAQAGRELWKRRGHLAAEPPGRLGEKQRAEEKRQARVELVSPPQVPPRPWRRSENKAARPVGMHRGKTKRDEAAERDAAHNRPFDSAVIKRSPHLLDIKMESTARIEREIGGRFIAERKRHDAEGRGQRIERWPYVLPATLDAWNQHQRGPCTLFDNPHLVI